MFTICAFTSVTMPFGVLISTLGRMDLFSMADRSCGDTGPKRWTTFKERLARSCGKVIWESGDPEGPIITDPTRYALAGVTLSNVKKLSRGIVHSYDLGLSSGISILAFRTGDYTPNRLCFGDFTENLLSDRKSTRLNSSHLVISYAV